MGTLPWEGGWLEGCRQPEEKAQSLAPLTHSLISPPFPIFSLLLRKLCVGSGFPLCLSWTCNRGLLGELLS